ncbi:MAG: hypothetical protein IJT91_05260 [Clostridia bacterium]|nr:hypothetical protein [Clostridia bacterium]
MFKEFSDRQFNGNKELALKCIAHEMAVVAYSKTENLENCHTMFSELADRDKIFVYNSFINDGAANKKFSQYNDSDNNIQSESFESKKRSAYIKMILSILGCCVSVAVAVFVILTKEDFLTRYLVILAPIVPIMFGIMIQRIAINIGYRKIIAYYENRSYLESQVKDLI